MIKTSAYMYFNILVYAEMCFCGEQGKILSNA